MNITTLFVAAVVRQVTAMTLVLLVGIALTGQVSAALYDGLVGYWTFDEPANIGLDSSAYGNNGTAADGYVSYSSAGKVGGAAKFIPGSNAGITVPNSVSLNFSGGITVAAWVRLDANDGNGTIVSKSDSWNNSESYVFWATFWKSDNRIAAFFDGGVHYDAGISVPTGEWAHLAMTYDGQPYGAIKFYVNGGLLSTVQANDRGMVTNSSDLHIGASPCPVPEDFSGLMDEVRLYNRVLSEPEIQALYGNPVISPTIAMTPTSAPPGTKLKEWGSGFTPNGTATLHFKKPDGTEYPTLLKRLDAAGNFDITYTAPVNKPSGLYSWWAIDNATGKKSNEVSFTITYDVPAGVTVPGEVVDRDSNGVAGATVQIVRIGGTGYWDQLTTTDSTGAFTFPALPEGDYQVSARWVSGKTDNRRFGVKKGESIYLRLVEIAPCSGGKVPILLVPGIMGSSTGKGGPYPYLPKDPPSWDDKAWGNWGDKGYHGLHDPLDKVGWHDLIEHLTKFHGYEKDCTLFAVPYDWRMTLDTKTKENSFTKYLIPNIDNALEKSGMSRVNIIAHSMGGLLVRSYIQSEYFTKRYDIDKFAMVGTPNHGSGMIYPIWEGGDPVTADAIAAYNAKLDGKEDNTHFYEATLMLQLKAHGKRWTFYSKEDVYNFLHNDPGMPAAGQLLPTYSFLDPYGSLSFEPNTWLTGLNNDPSGLARMGGEKDTSGKVKTKIFAGKGRATLDRIKVKDRSGNCTLYKDGTPTGYTMKAEGDGTVLKDSARLDALSFSDDKEAAHSELVSAYQDDIVKFITGVTASKTPVRTAGSARGLAATVSQLAITVIGGGLPLLQSPSGDATGFDPGNGTVKQAIPSSQVALDGAFATITVGDPGDGSWTLTLSDRKAEECSVFIAFMDENKTAQVGYMIYLDGYPRSLRFGLTAAAEDPIAVTLDPAPPAGVQSVQGGQGNTVLNWQSSPSPDVTAYRIYGGKSDDGPLSLLGVATATTFDTAAPWASRAMQPMWLLAVSAVTDDGRESVLSEVVYNAVSTGVFDKVILINDGAECTTNPYVKIALNPPISAKYMCLSQSDKLCLLWKPFSQQTGSYMGNLYGTRTFYVWFNSGLFQGRPVGPYKASIVMKRSCP